MYAVLFEVNPRGDRWDTYLNYAEILRPELQRIDGFIENIRYKSVRRHGWLLSLSTWTTEKALVRWRTHARHHEVQGNARDGVFSDYHLRVGLIVADTDLPDDGEPRRPEIERTEVGEASVVSLVGGRRAAEWVRQATSDQIAASLGVDVDAPGLIHWDVFDAVLDPGDIIAMLSWRRPADLESSRVMQGSHEGTRHREIQIVRDYGMYDRREAPQHFPAIQPAESDPGTSGSPCPALIASALAATSNPPSGD